MLKNDYQYLKTVLEKSKTILIISHVSPDPDAFCSTLFTLKLLKKNVTKKNIYANIEGLIPPEVSFLSGIEDITSLKLIDALKKYNPDTVFLLDGMNWERGTKMDAKEIRSYVKEKGISLIIIDHHEENGIEEDTALYINNHLNSSVEEAYNSFINNLNYKCFEGYAKILMLGLISDTGRFLYRLNNPEKTFQLATTLIKDGAYIEEIESELNTESIIQIKIIEEMAKNFVTNGEYSYTVISDNFITKYKDQLNIDEYKIAHHKFMDQHIRNVGSAKWGFTLRKDIENTNSELYSGSFRAVSDVIDTTIFSSQMEGGGHKAASGFKVRAKDIKSALKKVLSVIEAYKEEAYKNK